MICTMLFLVEPGDLCRLVYRLPGTSTEQDLLPEYSKHTCGLTLTNIGALDNMKEAFFRFKDICYILAVTQCICSFFV